MFVSERWLEAFIIPDDFNWSGSERKLGAVLVRIIYFWFTCILYNLQIFLKLSPWQSLFFFLSLWLWSTAQLLKLFLWNRYMALGKIWAFWVSFFSWSIALCFFTLLAIWCLPIVFFFNGPAFLVFFSAEGLAGITYSIIPGKRIFG